MHKSHAFLIAAAAAALPAAAVAQPAPLAAVTQRALPPAVAAEVDAAFDAFRERTPVPGLAYGVVKDGRLIHVATRGVQSLESPRPVTTQTRFRIASMSKAFTALAILKLRDEGRLSLDDLAEKHVPQMRGWTYPASDAPRIRVRDLLQHVAGFVTDDPWGDRQQSLSEADFTRMIAAGVPWSRVGQTQHEYSNFGYALLGRIVTNVSGQPYQRYIGRTILQPLGMTATGYEIRDVPADRLAVGYRWENDRWLLEPVMPDGAFGAMGGLHTTVDDYSKWVAFLLSAWPPRDGPEGGPVRRSTVRELAQGLNFVRITSRAAAAAGDECWHAVAYGMGMRVTPDCDLGLTLSHGGGYPGYGSFVVLAPERGVGAFGFANRTYQAPAVPVWQSLWAIERAGFAPPRELPLNPLVASMHERARAAYAAGSLQPLDGRLAMNFLMDRSAENWSRELAALKAQLGNCPTFEPIQVTGNLSANFRWNCDRGLLDGQILLAPTIPPTLQALRFAAKPQAAQ